MVCCWENPTHPVIGTRKKQGYNPTKYNGKEYETIVGINLYDYHARQQDLILGRFTTMDPLAEKYYNISPYASRGITFGTAAPAGIIPVNGSAGVSNTFILYDFGK